MDRPHDEQLRVTSASFPTFGSFELRQPAEAESSSPTVGQLLSPHPVADFIFVTRRINDELINGGNFEA